MTTGILSGNVSGAFLVTASLTPAEVATIVAVEQTFTVNGVKVGDGITVSPPGITSGVAPVCARVTAADTVGITFINPTAGNVTPLAGDYTFAVVRSESGAGASIASD